jgi:hypothetical protein
MFAVLHHRVPDVGVRGQGCRPASRGRRPPYAADIARARVASHGPLSNLRRRGFRDRPADHGLDRGRFRYNSALYFNTVLVAVTAPRSGCGAGDVREAGGSSRGGAGGDPIRGRPQAEGEPS